jgi:hypothetical protein
LYSAFDGPITQEFDSAVEAMSFESVYAADKVNPLLYDFSRRAVMLW